MHVCGDGDDGVCGGVGWGVGTRYRGGDGSSVPILCVTSPCAHVIALQCPLEYLLYRRRRTGNGTSDPRSLLQPTRLAPHRQQPPRLVQQAAQVVCHRARPHLRRAGHGQGLSSFTACCHQGQRGVVNPQLLGISHPFRLRICHPQPCALGRALILPPVRTAAKSLQRHSRRPWPGLLIKSPIRWYLPAAGSHSRPPGTAAEQQAGESCCAKPQQAPHS